MMLKSFVKNLKMKKNNLNNNSIIKQHLLNSKIKLNFKKLS